MTENYKKICQTLSGKVIINGELTSAQSKEKIAALNPATLEEIGFISLCRSQDLDLAVGIAEKAQIEWHQLGARERGKLIQACAQIFKDKKNALELAQIMSYETGKAIKTESLVELAVIADAFEFYGGLALELKGDTIPFDPNMLSMTIREPLGVIGAIVPWNVPLMLMSMKIAPALVAGNTVVMKPPHVASFCLLRAIELMQKILPKGVLNVITGDAETGKMLVSHPKIKKITFTGSVASGRDVYKRAAEKLIPVTLELGGKSPFIICEDADLDKAVEDAYTGMRFTRQGQSCSASTRFFIHESIHDDFVKKLLQKLDKKIIGDPMDEKTDIGSIISKEQFDRINQFIKIAENDPNLKIHYASKLPKEPHLQKGLFLRPCLITGLTNDHVICQQEIFGPIAAIIKWSNFEEAIKEANDVEFGLAAGIWTKNLPKALQAVHKLNAGFVQVNQYIVFRPSLPFGGFKHSGLGKEASLNAMIEHYTREKTIIINMKDE